MSKYGAFSGLYFPVFELSTGKYGPEKAPFLDTFHALQTVSVSGKYLDCAPQLISFDASEINVIHI